MSTAPATVEMPPSVFRVCRSSGPLRFSEIEPADSVRSGAGNRFDVPGGGVLYAATEAIGCYGETLARMRPTPKIREIVKHEKDFMIAGGVPQDWRLRRVVAEITAAGPLPFLDVEAAETIDFLNQEIPEQFVGLGYDDNIDVSDVRGHNRLLSRTIASWAYTAHDQDGEFSYSGIRYVSRLNSEWECWAIFEGTDVDLASERAIDLNDPDLQAIANRWDLRIF